MEPAEKTITKDDVKKMMDTAENHRRRVLPAEPSEKQRPRRGMIELSEKTVRSLGLKKTLKERIAAGESVLHYHGRRSGTRVRKILRQHPHMIADDRFFDVIITETMIHRAPTPGFIAKEDLRSFWRGLVPA